VTIVINNGGYLSMKRGITSRLGRQYRDILWSRDLAEPAIRRARSRLRRVW
jgi:hypothetical protein